MSEGTLSKRAGVFISAQFAANIIGIVTPMILARYLTRQSMGHYQQLWLVYSFLSQLLIMGLPSSLTYFYPTVEERYRATTVYVVVAGLLISGMIMGVGTFFGASYISAYFGHQQLMPLVRRFFLFYAFTISNSYMRRFLVSTNRYRFLMFWMPFDRGMNLLSFAVPAMLGYDLMVMVTVAVITSGIQFALAIGFTMWVISPFDFVWQSDLVKRILFYSLPIGLSAASGRISRSIGELVIGYFETAEFFAVFSWATRSLPGLSVIAASVMTVLIPELARFHKDGDYRQFAAVWHESIRKTSIFILGVFAFLMFMAAPYIVMLYSEQYVDSIIYFRVYLLGILKQVTMFGYVMQAIGRPRYILYATIVSLAFKSIFSVAMYKLFGLWGWAPMGPPVAGLVMSTGMSIFFLGVIARQLHLKPRHVWPWGTYLKTLALAMLAATVASMVLRVSPQTMASPLVWLFGGIGANESVISAARLVMAGVIFVPLYGVLLQVSGLIRPKDWRLLRDITIGRFIRK